MRILPLRKKDVVRVRSNVCERYPRLCRYLGEGKEGFRLEGEDFEVIVLNSVPALFRYEDKDFLYPTLVLTKIAGINSIHYAVVDEGAVKHLLNGANVMAPGITEVSNFRKGDVVAVWNPSKKAPLVIGEALMDSKEIMEVRRGKAIKNLHYAGDDIWELCLEYLRKVKK